MRASTRSTRSTAAPSRSAISPIEPTKYPASSSASISARADHALGRVGEQDRGLTLKMVAKRYRTRRHRPRGRAPRRRRGRRPSPSRRARSSHRLAADLSGGALRSASKALSISVPRLAARRPASVSSASPAQSPGSAGASAKPGGIGRLGARLLALLRPLKQRIARQFVLDELGQFEVRHLQELDRLQQLRRQNHGLTLPHRQFDRERHS